jgi:hypothetical protein
VKRTIHWRVREKMMTKRRKLHFDSPSGNHSDTVPLLALPLLIGLKREEKRMGSGRMILEDPLRTEGSSLNLTRNRYHSEHLPESPAQTRTTEGFTTTLFSMS